MKRVIGTTEEKEVQKYEASGTYYDYDDCRGGKFGEPDSCQDKIGEGDVKADRIRDQGKRKKERGIFFLFFSMFVNLRMCRK